MEISGAVRTLNALVRGQSDLAAAALVATDADVTAETAGTVTLAATRTAKVTASGSGAVTISGTPACTVSNLGAGTVTCGPER